MPDEDVSKKTVWWMDAVKSLGLPTVFLGVILYMLWSAGTWAGTEVVYPLFEHQSKVIDDAGKMIQTMDSSMNEINQTLEAHGEHAIESLKQINEARSEIRENGMKVDRIVEGNAEVLETLKSIENNTQPIRDVLPQ